MLWFLPTRGRPDECRALIAAMRACGDVATVVVMIDDDPAAYRGVPWPDNWYIHVAPRHLEMTGALNMLLALYPGRLTYGFFGDHFRPLTPWSVALARAADDWFMAWPCDGDSSYRQPAGAPTFGGKLVAALGWLCLPTAVHCCTDRVWWYLWRELGIARHVEAARFGRTWPLGAGQVARVYQSRDYNADDFAAWQVWERESGPELVARIRAAMVADGYQFADGRVVGGTPFKDGW